MSNPQDDDSDSGSRDEALVRAVLADEPGAADELIEQYRGLVVGLARSRFGFSSQEAEELLQTIIAILWRDDLKTLRAWRGHSKLSTYLSVIVCRQCRAQVGSEQRRRKLEAPELSADERPAPDVPPDTETLEREQSRALKAAMAQLTPRDRLVLSFRFFDEQEPRDFASTLGISPGAARKAVHDALARLRRKLRPELFNHVESAAGLNRRAD